MTKNVVFTVDKMDSEFGYFTETDLYYLYERYEELNEFSEFCGFIVSEWNLSEDANWIWLIAVFDYFGTWYTAKLSYCKKGNNHE